MLKIAHKGNINGPDPSRENTLEYLIGASEAGYGIELDLRKATDSTDLIVSHNPTCYSKNNDARRILNALEHAFIAINIKGDGLLPLLEDIKPRFNGFVFDFELWCINPDYEIHKYMKSGYKIARRYSDRGEFPSRGKKYDYIWFDEMDSTGSLNHRKVDLSKTIYVSPELHGRDINDQRSENFFAICTDYCDS